MSTKVEPTGAVVVPTDGKAPATSSAVIPSSVTEAIDNLPDGQAKQKTAEIAAGIAAAINEEESGNTDAAQAIASACAYLASEMASSPSGDSCSGQAAAIMALVDWIESINDLQASTAELTSKMTLLVKKLSDAENAVLATDAAAINAVDVNDKDHAGSQIAQKQGDYNKDQLTYNNNLATPQGLAEGLESLASDLAKATTGDYTNLGSIIQLWTNLAGIIR
jgi:hypothetical protein